MTYTRVRLNLSVISKRRLTTGMTGLAKSRTHDLRKNSLREEIRIHSLTGSTGNRLHLLNE